MTYDYACEICGVLHEEVHGAFEHPTVICDCGGKCFRMISTGVLFCGVNGRADMYNFTDFNTTGKPVVINSKTQWERHLKKHGLNDDVKNDPYTKSEIEAFARAATRKKEAAHKQIKNTIGSIIQNTPSSLLQARAKKVIKKGALNGR